MHGDTGANGHEKTDLFQIETGGLFSKIFAVTFLTKPFGTAAVVTRETGRVCFDQTHGTHTHIY